MPPVRMAPHEPAPGAADTAQPGLHALAIGWSGPGHSATGKARRQAHGLAEGLAGLLVLAQPLLERSFLGRVQFAGGIQQGLQSQRLTVAVGVMHALAPKATGVVSAPHASGPK